MRKVIGKVRAADLNRFIFRRLGKKDKSVILGPQYGEDAAVIRLGKQDLVASADPIVFSLGRIGKLGIDIVTNDLAACGVKPRWILDILFLPDKEGGRALKDISKQLNSESKKRDVAIVGGHSEYVPGLKRPFVALTALGIVKKNKWVKTSEAKPGDLILLTKSAGLEVTGIVALEFGNYLRKKGISEKIIKTAVHYLDKVSVIKEAMVLAGIAHAMHDPTEGGVLAALQEMATASRVIIEVEEDKIPIQPVVRKISQVMKINPLKCFSSGALLVALPSNKVGRALKLLKRKRIPVTVIGKVIKKTSHPCLYFYQKEGELRIIKKIIKDEFYSVWDKMQSKQ